MVDADGKFFAFCTAKEPFDTYDIFELSTTIYRHIHKKKHDDLYIRGIIRHKFQSEVRKAKRLGYKPYGAEFFSTHDDKKRVYYTDELEEVKKLL